MIVELSKKLDNLESAVFTKEENGVKTTSIKVDGEGIKLNKNGISLAELNKDGLIFKKEDGSNGISVNSKDGKITGLANITEKDSGDTAVNKKYVDDKLENNTKELKETIDNIPVMYTDKDGNKVVRKRWTIF